MPLFAFGRKDYRFIGQDPIAADLRDNLEYLANAIAYLKASRGSD